MGKCDQCGLEVEHLLTWGNKETKGKGFCSEKCTDEFLDSGTKDDFCDYCGEKLLNVRFSEKGKEFCSASCMKERRKLNEMVDSYVTKDSGEREEFDTGAKRDTRTGKGRYDLIPPKALKRIAGVYERGAVKYGDRNWQKGMPYSRFLDSALRHVNTWAENEQDGVAQDEDHLAQAIFNLLAIMHFEEVKPELNDLA